MTAIEPGDKFVIEYGNGHRMTVAALTLNQKRALTTKIDEIQEAQEENKIGKIYDLVADVLSVAVGEKNAATLADKVDDEMAMDIVNAVMAKNSLTEDDLGKSESPH